MDPAYNNGPGQSYQNSAPCPPPYPGTAVPPEPGLNNGWNNQHGGMGDVMDGTKPTAPPPPIDQLEKVSGYEHITFNPAPLAPPTMPTIDYDAEKGPDRSDVQSLTNITEDQVRDSLIQFASDHCCYGKGPARDLAIEDIRMSSAFHYTLETFTEKRETNWAYIPYSGEHLDTNINGAAPLPWDIPVQAPRNFQNAEKFTEVPHTASIKACHMCSGMGRERCSVCIGNGQVRCTWCSGTGRTTFTSTHHDSHSSSHGGHNHHGGGHHTEECLHCHGCGHQRCNRCMGHGQITCNCCSGRGQLKCFVQLKISWINHLEDHISEQTSMPKDLIREVSGHVAFEEELPLVWPVTHCPDNAINQASACLVRRHQQSFPLEKIILQRHKVRIVPIGEVYYKLKSKSGTFCVYGYENRVHFPDYPAKCCCGCTIL